MSCPGMPVAAACPTPLGSIANAPVTLRTPRVRQIRWTASAVCASWDATSFAAPPATRAALHDSLWHSLTTEYDARHLSAYLRQQAIPLSPAFWAMERAWAEDEQNHCLALSWLYSRLYGVAEPLITDHLRTRQPDFSLLSPLLRDEFRLCVVLAFDELASTRAYARDVATYAQLGAPAATLLRYAARDEMLHCCNAVDVLVSQHGLRLPEIGPVIDEVIAHDTSPQFSYRATFLLDQIVEPSMPINAPADARRNTDELHREFLRDCGRRLLRLLGKAQTCVKPCYW